MYQKSREGWMKHLDFMILNLVCLHVAFVLSYGLRMGWKRLPYAIEDYRNIAVLLSVADVLITLLLNTLHNVMRRGYYQEFAATVKHTVLVFLAITLYLFSVKESSRYSRVVLYLTMLLYMALNYPVRLLWKRILSKLDRNTRSILIATNDVLAEEILSAFAKAPNEGVKVSGFIILDREMTGEVIQGVPVVATKEDAAAYICREWVDEVLIHLPTNVLKPIRLIEQCREMGITVHMTLDNLMDVHQQQFVEKLAGYTVLTSSINTATPLQAFLKRGMDIVGGLAGCLLAGIALLFIGPKIYKQSPGPVIFSQERIGMNGKKFKFYKIRSMYLDAEERKKELMEQNRVSDGMMFKLDFDPRIIGNEILPDGTHKTGIGEFIRKTSLDELPQFWNVLKGDMSLVGTRPPTVDEWEKYKLHHRARLAMKPGITGMWQVSGRSNITDFEEVVKLDTEYICGWSMGLDFKILFKTVGAVFGKTGAM